MKRITQQHRLDLFIKWTWTRKRRQNVNLKKPWLQTLINDHIKTIYFITAVFAPCSSILWNYIRLDRHECLNANILDLRINLCIIDSFSLIFFSQHFKTPFWLNLHDMFFIIFASSRVRCRLSTSRCITLLFGNLGRIRLCIFWIVVSLFIYRVIGQMNKALFQTIFICRIRLSCQPDQTFLKYVSL